MFYFMFYVRSSTTLHVMLHILLLNYCTVFFTVLVCHCLRCSLMAFDCREIKG